MIKALLIIVSALLIIVLMMQHSKSGDISNAFGAGNSELSLFSNKKERGFEKTLTLITTGLAVLFMVLVVLCRIL